MEINELRIGNFIQIKDVITQVEGFCAWDGLVQSSNFAERDIDEFEPIPITEEWLLSFGFTYRTDTGFSGWYSNPILGESIRIFEIENKWFKYYSAHVVIKYVHELQNLYFSLTGEEL